MIRFLLLTGLLLIGWQAMAQKVVQPDTIRRKGGIVIMSNQNHVSIQANQSKITINNEGGIVIESTEDIKITTQGNFTVEAADIQLNASGDMAFTAGGTLNTEAMNTEIHSHAETKISANASLEVSATATLNIGGALITIGNGSTMPAARIGDTVVSDPAQAGVSKIITGANTVLIGG